MVIDFCRCFSIPCTRSVPLAFRTTLSSKSKAMFWKCHWVIDILNFASIGWHGQYYPCLSHKLQGSYMHCNNVILNNRFLHLQRTSKKSCTRCCCFMTVSVPVFQALLSTFAGSSSRQAQNHINSNSCQK